MDVGLTGLIASKLAPTDFCVVRTCCEQLLPPVGASLLAIAVVPLHSGWICRWLLISTPRQSKETKKKRRFPFLKEAPFFKWKYYAKQAGFLWTIRAGKSSPIPGK
jgi:hypothetical protein